MTVHNGRATDWNISGWILGIVLVLLAFGIATAFIPPLARLLYPASWCAKHPHNPNCIAYRP